MILWLASYPKSGNTWVRSFIVSLLYSKEGKANLKDISKIKQYPLRLHFKTLTNNIDDLQQLYKNWIPSQKIINLDNKIKFLKTHHIMCNFGKYSFTNYENTFGVIYIVRDPRNIVTSLMNHYSFLNYTEAKNFLLNENQTIGRNLNEKNNKDFKEKEVITLISSWKNHYNSWKNFNKNFLLIKYENLLNDTENEFKKIKYYLSEKLNTNCCDEKFKNAIETNSFNNLKKQEKLYGFEESVKNLSTLEKKNFFLLGHKNNWKDLLDENIRLEIENKFKKEMSELGYL